MEGDHVVSIELIKAVFESEHVPVLIDGSQTHDAVLRLTAQLVRFEKDPGRLKTLFAATLPKGYTGDSLDELPRMISSALSKGFDEPGQGNDPGGEFQMTAAGLFMLKSLASDKVIRIPVSGPFEIVGLVRDTKSSGWARLLKWEDIDGNAHEFIASDKLLLNEHDLVCGDLCDQGLRINKSQQSNLARYILQAKTEVRITQVARTGWHTIAGGNVFVLPNQILGPRSDRIMYDSHGQKQDEYLAAGSLADWKQMVSVPAGSHSLAALAISASFAGPLLHLANQESGGIHLFGNSSTGKTTLLRLAASVWGDGGLVHSWRATSNGIEGVANRTSDIILILDELGQLDSKEAATSLYMLASGVGKIRMNRNSTLQDIKTWRAFMLSSGEMTVETKITQLRGAIAYTGAGLRLLNVSADRGLGHGAFDDPGPTGSAGDMVKAHGEAVTHTYGVAGPEFVGAILKQGQLGDIVRERINKFTKDNVKNGSDGQIERAAKRFGLVAVAGELATELGVTGWKPGTAASAAGVAFERWQLARGGDASEPAEDRRAILHVTNIIVTYGESRFDELDRAGFVVEPIEDSDKPSAAPRPSPIRYGWRKFHGDERIWMIEDSKWESEICRGFDPVQVSRALARHGMLKTAKTRLTYAERFEGKRNKRFHVITGKILTRDYDHSTDDIPDDDDGHVEFSRV